VPRKFSKRLVIDKDVFCAAGYKEDPENPSYRCRSVLDAIFRICHRIVLTKDIYREYLKDIRDHPATYGFEWLSNMRSKDKIYPVEQETISLLSLREEVLNLELSSTDEEEILDDIHLLEAALVTDKRIVSMDGVLRTCLLKTIKDIKAIGSIAWVDPHNEFDDCIDWLEAGAPLNRKMKIGYRK